MSDGNLESNLVQKEVLKQDLNEELDYDYEEDENNQIANGSNNNNNNKESGLIKEDEESDGEIKSDNQDELDDGEVKSPKLDKASERDENEQEKQSEEEGEINDGVKLKKAFIPKVLCKYYQRGKCTWGRTCKFLHPGVNDVGNYTLLEYQDPTASLYQQKQIIDANTENEASNKLTETEIPQTESAWERGLRHAKEMKEKALKRKQIEKDQFDDKKMNLSLKEFENEKENDERYVNVEMATHVDDDLEDDEVMLFANSGRIKSTYNNDRNSNQQSNNSTNQNYYNRAQTNRYDRSGPSDKRSRSNIIPNRDSHSAKADEWHDPWERSRQVKKNSTSKRDRSNSYSSADTKSRSRSRSKSSNSSRSSYSSSSRSSSRSSSQSPTKTNQKISNSKLSGKSGPGRQIPEASLKKTNADRKGKKNESGSSESSYSSNESEMSHSQTDSDIESYSDEDKRKKSAKLSKQSQSLNSKGSLKRAGTDLGSESKKSKSASSPNSNEQNSKNSKKDKKQMIKDQLKLLESALNKKKQMNK